MRWFVLLVLIGALPARAVPPDARLVLAPGSERFLKPGFLPSDVAVDPPGAFRAELQPSGELFLEVPAGARGPAWLFAVGTGSVFVWDVCLSAEPERDCPRPTHPLDAKRACPDLAETSEEGQRVVKATVASTRCLDALVQALAHAPVAPASLRLVLEEAPARELYGRVLGALKKDPVTAPIKAGFFGATLSLRGPLTREGVTRAVVTAWKAVPGRLSFETATPLAPARGGR